MRKSKLRIAKTKPKFASFTAKECDACWGLIDDYTDKKMIGNSVFWIVCGDTYLPLCQDHFNQLKAAINA